MTGKRAENDRRLHAIEHWLRYDIGLNYHSIELASADASFRRYFRVVAGNSSSIVMDAPPQQEDIRPFVSIAGLLARVGINVPTIVDQSRDQGFLLMSDLGQDCYLDALNGNTAEALYRDAMGVLVRMQKRVNTQNIDLPVYDEPMLRRELKIFRDWFLENTLRIKIEPAIESLLDRVWTFLVQSAVSQPQVFVHRDYHSRNLMVVPENNPGVLDFQDAVVGPITYDIVSLLRDCYICWPEQKITEWLSEYRYILKAEGLDIEAGGDCLTKWFDLMGLQRHLKVAGIFSRLGLRDGKTGYTKDIPCTLKYIKQVCSRYEELEAFQRFLEDEVVPRFDKSAGFR